MRTIYYYHLYFTETLNIISSSVDEYLQKVCEIDYQNRFITIDGYPVVLHLREIEPQTGNKFYTMVRFKKDAHLYKGSLTDPKLEEIKGEIAQLTTFLYDERKNIMIEEYSPEGIKHKDILKYLNSFISGTNIRLDTQVINEGYTIETIQGTSRISSIEVKIKLDRGSTKLFTKEDNPFSTISSVFTRNKTDTLDADFAILTFKKERNKTLHIDSVISFLKLLNIKEDCIIAVNVQFKYKGRMTTIDIKNIDKPLSDRVLENSVLKEPFLIQIRNELLMLYMDKHAGRFDNSSKNIIEKMKRTEEYQIIPKPVPKQAALFN